MPLTEQAYTIVGDRLDGRTVYVTYDDEPPTEIEISGVIHDIVGDEAIQRDVS